MNVPAGISHPAVSEAAAHHTKMLADRDAAKAKLKAAERHRPRAVEQDSAAYADALAKGAKDPGEKATAKADDDIHQAKGAPPHSTRPSTSPTPQSSKQSRPTATTSRLTYRSD